MELMRLTAVWEERKIGNRGKSAEMREIVKREGGFEATRMAHFSRGDEN